MNTCGTCKYYKEHHYEELGETPYIKANCTNKFGMNNEYQVHEWEYCSRWKAKEENKIKVS